MDFKKLTKMFLEGQKHTLNEDAQEFGRSLLNLKVNGVSGKATTKGIVITYNGKKYTIPTDCSEIPDELKEFEKDIKIAFKGKSHGAVEKVRNPVGSSYTPPDPYKVGHRAQFLTRK